MRSIALGVVVLVAAGGLGWYFFGLKNPFTGRRSQIEVGSRRFEVEVADTAATRARGLSGRSGLGENEGVVFVFGKPGRYPFWMKDMRFPIDMVWVKEGRVAGITENVAPEPAKTIFTLTVYYPPDDADMVLEVNAGAARRYGIAVGDHVAIVR